jgi:hypothetical protein
MHKDINKAIKVLKRTQKQHKKFDDKWKEIQEQVTRLKARIAPISTKYSKEKIELISKIRMYYNDQYTKTGIKSSVYDFPEVLNTATENELLFHYLKLTKAVKNKSEFNKLMGIVEEPREAVKTELVRRQR